MVARLVLLASAPITSRASSATLNGIAMSRSRFLLRLRGGNVISEMHLHSNSSSSSEEVVPAIITVSDAIKLKESDPLNVRFLDGSWYFILSSYIR